MTPTEILSRAFGIRVQDLETMLAENGLRLTGGDRANAESHLAEHASLGRVMYAFVSNSE